MRSENGPVRGGVSLAVDAIALLGAGMVSAGAAPLLLAGRLDLWPYCVPLAVVGAALVALRFAVPAPGFDR